MKINKFVIRAKDSKVNTVINAENTDIAISAFVNRNNIDKLVGKEFSIESKSFTKKFKITKKNGKYPRIRRIK
jgi:hypothetical protein